MIREDSHRSFEGMNSPETDPTLVPALSAAETANEHRTGSPALLLSQEEAAHLLGVERTTIWRMCCRGDLDRVHIGRRALVTRASIEAFIASQLQSD